MTSAIRQIHGWDPNPSQNGAGGSPSGFLFTFPSATLAGSCLLIAACIANQVGTTVTAVSDTVNGSYTNIDAQAGGAGALDLTTWYFPNAASLPAGYNGIASGGSATTLVDSTAAWSTNQWAGVNLFNLANGTNVTVTSNTATTLTFASTTASASGNPYALGGYVRCTISAFDDYPAAIGWEVTGVTATPLAGHSKNQQTTTGAGTGNVTTGTAACGSSPVILIGVSSNTSDANSPYIPTVGSGFTSDGSFWVWNQGQVSTLAEHENVANPGTVGAIFNAQGADVFQSMMVALTDAPSLLGQILT